MLSQTPFDIKFLDSNSGDIETLLHFHGGATPDFRFDVNSVISTFLTASPCVGCCWDYFILIVHVVSETEMHFHVEQACTDTPRKKLTYEVNWQGLHEMKLADAKYINFYNFYTPTLYG